MTSIQNLLADSQRAIEERFGFRIVAQDSIEFCQVVEYMSHLGMKRIQYLFADAKCLLQVWFGLLRVRAPGQVDPHPVEEVRGFWKVQAICVGQGGTGLRVRQV